MVSSQVNIQSALSRLLWICGHYPVIFIEIEEKKFSQKPSPQKWSKKEILGHLIDSAANNHHRLVRAQFEEKPLITYDPDKWNAANYYQAAETKRLVELWENYNRHLYELCKSMPPELLMREVRTGPDSAGMTLEEVIVDYVKHLEHHLKEITA